MHDTIDQLCQVQRRLAALRCPACARGRIELRLRCDLSAHECPYVVICERCASEYWVDRDSMSDADALDGYAFQCDAVTHRCWFG